MIERNESTRCVPLRPTVSSALPPLAALTHPHIRRVLSAALAPSPAATLALTLAPTDGVPLAVWLSRPLPHAERLALTRSILDQLCQAFAAAHRIVPPIPHGALRPDCVTVERRGQQPFVRVEGFGLFDLVPLSPDARLPPETDPADPRATPAGDLFALGVMLATLLARIEPPLHADAVLTCTWVTARFPSASPSLHAVIRRCMHPSPGERPADVAALRELLRAADWSPCEPAPPVSPPAAAPMREVVRLPPPPPEPLDEEETVIDRAPTAPVEEATLPCAGLPTRVPAADDRTLVARSPLEDEGTLPLPVSVRKDTQAATDAPCEETDPLTHPPTLPGDDDPEATAIERPPAPHAEALTHEPTLPIGPPRRPATVPTRDREGVPWSAVALLVMGAAILALLASWGAGR